MPVGAAVTASLLVGGLRFSGKDYFRRNACFFFTAFPTTRTRLSIPNAHSSIENLSRAVEQNDTWFVGN